MNAPEQDYDRKKRRMYWYMKQLFKDSDCGYKDRCANATQYSIQEQDQ